MTQKIGPREQALRDMRANKASAKPKAPARIDGRQTVGRTVSLRRKIKKTAK